MRRFAAAICFVMLFAVLDGGRSAPGAGTRPRRALLANRSMQVITFISLTPTRTPTPINVGNFVWDDLDEDGRQDAGEPGMSGITVQLWNDTKTALIDSAVTNASGVYTLVAPMPDDYRVRVLLPAAADQFSPKNNAGADDQIDSDINTAGLNFGFTDVFNIASNVISTTVYDAGLTGFTPFTPTPTNTQTSTSTNTPTITTTPTTDVPGDPPGGSGTPWCPPSILSYCRAVPIAQR